MLSSLVEVVPAGESAEHLQRLAGRGCRRTLRQDLVRDRLCLIEPAAFQGNKRGKRGGGRAELAAPDAGENLVGARPVALLRNGARHHLLHNAASRTINRQKPE